MINDNNKLFHVGSVIISIDDLINPNIERILKMNALENESSLLDILFYLIIIYIFLGQQIV